MKDNIHITVVPQGEVASVEVYGPNGNKVFELEVEPDGLELSINVRTWEITEARTGLVDDV